MRITQWDFGNLREDGALIDEQGNIEKQFSIVPSISRTTDDGGCGEENCTCDKVFSMVINFGYCKAKRCISGVTILFDSEEEFWAFNYEGITAQSKSYFFFNAN